MKPRTLKDFAGFRDFSDSEVMVLYAPGYAYTEYPKLMYKALDLDPYDAEETLTAAAAFAMGWHDHRVTAPGNGLSAAINYFCEDYINEIFTSVMLHLHNPAPITWVGLRDKLFAKIFASMTPKYQSFDPNWANVSLDDNVDLFESDIYKMRELVRTYNLRAFPELPEIWKNPKNFQVPTNDSPFFLMRLSNGVIVITDSCVGIAIKPLSTGKHFAVMITYAPDRRMANMSPFRMRIGHVPVVNEYPDAPHLYQLASGFDEPENNRCTIRFRDKKIVFDL